MPPALPPTARVEGEVGLTGEVWNSARLWQEDLKVAVISLTPAEGIGFRDAWRNVEMEDRGAHLLSHSEQEMRQES